MGKTVFISGSRGINELDIEAKQALDKIMVQGLSVVVGDCYGVDRAVQIYLAEHTYFHVTVYFIAKHKQPRNYMHPQFDSYCVPAANEMCKNTAMAKAANYGLAIWDGASRGTADAITCMQANHIPHKILRQVSESTTLFCRVGTHPRPNEEGKPARAYPKGFRVCTECVRQRTPEELRDWNGQPNCPKRQAVCSVTKRLTEA